MNPLVRRIRETIISPEEANSRIFPNFVVMKFSRLILIAVLPLLLLLALSCQSNGIRQELLAVESYLNSDPARALAVLDSMDDGTTLRSRRDRAHYALLKSMALDKNYIDLTSDSLIAPAVAYYSRHGTADEKMKAYYYQGRVYQNAKNYDAAFLSFSKSEECMDQSTDDRQKGIIYIAQSYLYGIRYHYDQQKKYIDLAKIAYARAGDYERVQLCQVEEAIYYQTTLDWNRADSVYQSILRTEFDERRMLTVYSHYARMLVLQPIQEPARAREIFEKHCGVLDAGVSATKIGVYAYALVLLGEDDLANQQIARYKDSLMRIRGNDLDYWLYLIEKHRGNLSSALASLEWDYGNQTEQVRKILSESMSSIVSEYHYGQLKEQELRSDRISIFMLLVSVVLVFVVLFGYYAYRRKIYRQYNRNLVLQEALECISIENQNRYNSLVQIRERLKRILGHQLEIQKTIVKSIPEKEEDPTLKMTILLKTLESIRNDRSLLVEMEEVVDEETSGAMTLLRKESVLKDQEFYYLCCFLLGLDSSGIAVMMHTTNQYVYKVKRQIKLKLASREEVAIKNLLNLL